MTKAEFISLVQQHGGISEFGEAEKATFATLSTFAEGLTVGESERLAEWLPDGLKEFIFQTAEAENFHLDEFLIRVNEKEGGNLPFSKVEGHAAAVLSILALAIPEEEKEEILRDLPRDLKAFMVQAQGIALQESR